MTADSIRALSHELPDQGAWVRKLARGLVRDEASADDVAQDAALAALRGYDAQSPLRPWLARVARNFARRRWRESARRTAREHAAARPESLPAVDESAARVEIQRLLVEELGALEAALRHVLVRRYFDGWSAARIARETGEPAATVRWRLQRGLAELRARLDRRGGGDGLQWRLALLPVCGPVAPWPATALSNAREALRPLLTTGTIQGILTMKLATQALAAGTLLAAVGLGVWWRTGQGEGPAREEASAPPPPVAELRAPEPSSEPVTSPARREALPGVPAVREVPTSALAPAEQGARLAGRLVDEALVPIGGARVEQHGADEVHVTHASSDGSFELAVRPRRDACTLRIEAAGFAATLVEATVHAEERVNLGDVVLAPGGRVRGRVLGPDGAPFAGASVSVTRPDLWGSLEERQVSGPFGPQLVATLSAADGRFELDGAGVGPMRVWAGAPGMRYAVSPPVEVRAREVTDEIELRLEPVRRDDRIRGVVLAPDGSPVPGARLGVWEHAGGGGTSYSIAVDDSGHFQLTAKRGRVYDLRAGDKTDRWAASIAKGVQPGTHDVELRFHEPRWIDVTVRDSRGGRLDAFRLLACSPDGMEEFERTSDVRRDDEQAQARLRVPEQPFLVRVDARGFQLADLGPFAPEDAPTTLEFELVPEPGIHGRVLADGMPLPDARVTLFEQPPGLRIEHQGFLTLVMPNVLDETRTDAEGRFILKLRQRSTFVVRAEAEGRAPSDSGPLELVPEIGRSGLELVLGRGGDLEGRVRVAPGRDPAGVIVAVNRGDGFPRTVRSDSEGRFGFGSLSAGPWHLARGKQEFNAQGGGTAFSGSEETVVLPFNCTIVEGQTTYQDLDLSDYQPCVLAGVLLVNGAPASGWGVAGWPGDAQAIVGELPSSATAADGSFTLTIEEPGLVRLSFSPPPESGGSGRIDARTEVRPGANTWRSDFQMGRLTGRCLTTLADEEIVLFYTSAEGVEPSCWLTIVPDESGRYVLPFVPAGKGAVQRNDGGRWSRLIETEVLARKERVLDVP